MEQEDSFGVRAWDPFRHHLENQPVRGLGQEYFLLESKEIVNMLDFSILLCLRKRLETFLFVPDVSRAGVLGSLRT